MVEVELRNGELCLQLCLQGGAYDVTVSWVSWDFGEAPEEIAMKGIMYATCRVGST